MQNQGVIFEIRNFFAGLTQPQQSWCRRCQGRWQLVKPHVTKYGEGHSIMALCETCWVELDMPSRRLMFYREQWREKTISMSAADAATAWQEIKTAVMGGY